MSAMHIRTENGFESIQGSSLEGLITSHFNRAYLILSAFVDDPRTCLQLTENLFRTVDLNGDVSDKGMYGALIRQIRQLPNKTEFLQGVPHETVTCWLLKETSDLRYAEIATLMGLDREQVKLNIAEIRAWLLS